MARAVGSIRAAVVRQQAVQHDERALGRLQADPRWRYFELDTGHNLHYTAPEETVGILDQLARG